MSMNPTLKRYLLSSVSTFLTVFLGSLSLSIGNWSGTVITSALVWSLVLSAARAAIKAVVESFAGQHADLPTGQA